MLRNKKLVQSFLAFFFLLSSYYILRPLRETMGTVYGDVDQLFLTVFLIMLGLVPAFGWLSSNLSRGQLFSVVFRSFSVLILAVAYFVYTSPEIPRWLAGSLYVLVSVFGVFNISLFWSLMADIYNSESSKKFFGIITAGGSLGGLLSSLATGLLASKFNTAALLLVAVALLEIFLVLVHRLNKEQSETEQQTETKASGSIFAGLKQVLANKYLLLFACFMLLGKFCSTMVYLQVLDIVAAVEPNIDKRTAIFAWENLVTQIISFAFQGYFTAIIIRKVGLPFALSILPIVLGAGFFSLTLYPSLVVAFCLQVTQRGLAYGIAKPSKEILFTVISREEKYKAKNFMDTVLDRGADAASSKLYALVSASVAASSLAFVVVPLALAWSGVGVLLGFKHKKLSEN